MLRAIFVFHRDVNGWNDIGYNFVDRPLRAHLRGARGRHRRAGRRGAAGRLQPRLHRRRRARLVLRHADLARRRAARSQRLLAWKLSLHGAPARGTGDRARQPGRRRLQPLPGQRAACSLPRIAGHRDADSTDCPGDALYGELPRDPPARAAPGAAAGAGDARADAGATPAPRTAARRRTARRRPGRQRSRRLAGSAGASSTGRRSPARSVQIQARSVARRGELVHRADARRRRAPTPRAAGRCRRASRRRRRRGCRCGRSTRARRRRRGGPPAAGAAAPLLELSCGGAAPSAGGQLPRPRPCSSSRLPRGEPALGLGLHEQRRRRARAAPSRGRRR